MKIKVDTDEFIKSAKNFNENSYPEVVAKSMRLIVTRATIGIRAATRQNFKLHSEWIPNNITGFPSTKGQINRVKNDVKKFNSFIASIKASDKIAFMSMHDEGGTRTSDRSASYLKDNKKVLALPGKGLQKLKTKTGAGKTRKKYKPAELIKNFNKNAPRSRSRRRLAFIMRAKSGHLMIVRRVSKAHKPVEILYHFKDSAKIKRDWEFTKVGKSLISRYYLKDFARVFNSLR